MAGLMSVNELAAGACMLNLDLMVFLANSGVNRVVSMKVGNLLGAYNVKQAQDTMKAGVLIVIPYCVIISFIVYNGWYLISEFYT